jgi:hypothetical protein
MCVGEEEVSLSQPITVAVPSKEEEVLVPQSPAVVVPPEEEEEVPPEQEEVCQRMRTSQSRRASLSLLMTRASMMKALYHPW